MCPSIILGRPFLATSNARIKISVNTDISVIGFYENIENIGGYFYKNIGY